MKEPDIRTDLKGAWRIMNGDVLTTMGSFDTKKEANEWATWNNFGEKPHGYGIIRNPD